MKELMSAGRHCGACGKTTVQVGVQKGRGSKKEFGWVCCECEGFDSTGNEKLYWEHRATDGVK